MFDHHTAPAASNSKWKPYVSIAVLLLVVVAVAFAYRRYQEDLREKQQVAQQQKEEAERKRLESEALARRLEEERQSEAAAAAQLRRDTDNRCKLLDGLNIVMAYKDSGGQTIQAGNLEDGPLPKSQAELQRRPRGDCKEGIFFYQQAIAIPMAKALEEQPEGVLKGIIDSGFGRVVVMDPTIACQALVMPRPLGLGEFRCFPRGASRRY